MPHIHQAVLIGAPAEIIYQALTTQEGLAAWWTPDVQAEPELNTTSRFTFGSGYFKEMKITELNPFERVQWLCLAGADEWIGTTIAFRLQTGDNESLLHAHPEATDQIQQQTTNGKATLVTLQHDNWKDDTPMFAECSYTWGQFLRSLKESCETGKGRPWPNQHQTAY